MTATPATMSTDIERQSESRTRPLVPPPGIIPKQVNFVLGGMAGVGAVFFTQPLDLVKNRMQISGEGGKVREHKTSIHAMTRVLRNEGIFGIYNGLSAGVLRQATYSTCRLGIYQALFDKFTSADGTPPGLIKKLLLGMTAGGSAAIIGNPTEVALVRMTLDGRLPAGERRGYNNALNAMYRIAREEGIGTLWRGCSPTVMRAMIVNAAQLATYSQAKQFLLSTQYFNDGIKCHFVASMISGLVTTATSLPVDITKTRIQNMKYINGVPEYRGVLDVVIKLIRNEGVFSLWKGFTPYYARLGPHTVLIFVFWERLKILYYANFIKNQTN